jgi:predicted nuclease of predicted toxin-antitoxin system
VRLYVDDDSVDPSLIRLLHRDGHDVQIPADAGLAGSSDQTHLAHAIREGRAILTRNYKDFEALHDLVVRAANGHHADILVVRYDNNPRNSMSSGDIARALRNLENAGVAIADSYHELNHWK